MHTRKNAQRERDKRRRADRVRQTDRFKYCTKYAEHNIYIYIYTVILFYLYWDGLGETRWG